jgi:hypothetical protein
MMGLDLQQLPHHCAPQLTDILPSQPCSRIKKWRSLLQGSYITKIESHITNNINDVISAVPCCRMDKISTIPINFSIDKPIARVHPTEGIPILFSDQLNVISKTLSALCADLHAAIISTTEPLATINTINQDHNDIFLPPPHNDQPTHSVNTSYTDNDYSHLPFQCIGIVCHMHNTHHNQEPQKLTYKQTRNSPHVEESCQSEFQQLDQYDSQNMYGQPTPKTPGMTNIWRLLWTYVVKPPPQNRKKA